MDGTGIADIRAVVRTLVDLPIVVLTPHVHWDHIGGHGHFGERLVHRLDAPGLDHRAGGSWQIVWEQATAIPNDFDLFVQSIQAPS